MYEPFRDGEVRLTLVVTWDPNTAKGFGVALASVLLLMIFLSFVEPPEWAEPLSSRIDNSIPIEMFNLKELRFGDGDGTGGSKGNLTKEGSLHKGELPDDQFANATIKAPSGDEVKTLAENGTVSPNMKPTSDFSSGDNKDGGTGTATTNVGSPNGTESGTGLGDAGNGSGAGTGLGRISWGGGGNRVVTYKPGKPKYPENVDIKEAVVTIKFYVDPSGSVIRAVPVNRIDPRLEAVAIRYVKRYKFNPLDSEDIMVGTISLIFRKS